MTKNNAIFILHSGNSVDGSLGRITVFDFEEDAQEIFDYMKAESLVSINQGLTVTKVSGLSEDEVAAIRKSPEELVESEFEDVEAERIAYYGSSQESWNQAIFDEDTEEVSDALEENPGLVIHL